MTMFGDILGTFTEAWNASQNRNAAEDRQTQNEAFQERMSNTQYQRMVADLNAAGLSPMLAYTGGKPNVPSSGIATGTSSVSGPQLGASDLREAQAEAAREQSVVLKTTAEVNGASAEKLRAETRNIEQDTENKRLYPGMNEAQIKELIERSSQHGASANQLRALADEIRQSIKLREPEQKFKEDHPTYSKYASPVQDALKTIFNAIGLVRGSAALPNVTKVVK